MANRDRWGMVAATALYPAHQVARLTVVGQEDRAAPFSPARHSVAVQQVSSEMP
jgi:hypothetical protein